MQKFMTCIITLCLIGHFRLQAQVAINTDASLPDASAMLDVKSIAKGILVPRVTTVQRTAIATPADGLLVYDTDTKNFWYFKNGSGWQQIINSVGSIILPYSATVTSPSSLFALTNLGDGASLDGISNSITSSIVAVRGIVSSTSPGGFSTALRGINNGTGALGVGVWGSQNGSGWGMYGTSVSGIGVYGNNSGGGYGMYANSSTGTGLFATSNTGQPANFSITNNANNNNVLDAATNGAGIVVNAVATGAGDAIDASSTGATGVNGFSGTISGAGILGHNTAGGEAVTGLALSTGFATGAVVGRNDGPGYGVSGFISTDASGNAIGVRGQVGLNNSTGKAGYFENVNASNGFPTVVVTTNGSGDGVNSTATSGGSGVNGFAGSISGAGVLGHNTGGGEAVTGLANTTTGIGAVVGRNDGAGYGVYGFISTDASGNAAAVNGTIGLNNSTGNAGRFQNTNASNGLPAVQVTTNGSGDGVNSTATSGGSGVNGFAGSISGAGVLGHNTGGGEAVTGLANTTTGIGAVVGRNDGAGYGVYGFIRTDASGNAAAVNGTIGLNNSTGNAGRFQNTNASNGLPAVQVTTNGSGDGVNSTSTGGSGVNGFSGTISGAGVLGHNTGGGEAVTGLTASTGFATGAVVGRNDGPGYGVSGFISTDASGTAIGVRGQVGLNNSTGVAGHFENVNASNGVNTLEAVTNGTGTGLFVNHTGASGNLAVFQNNGVNVARIDKTGACFFDGGFNAFGADLAEAFAVTGNLMEYEPGDVLVIATTASRTLEKSAGSYSSRVAGVYATKPGVLLTAGKTDNALVDKVPLGVVGVIPTKVCNENGPILPGDILVSASKSGYAMKADLDKLKPGQAIGKALEPFNRIIGKIEVLVNVK